MNVPESVFRIREEDTCSTIIHCLLQQRSMHNFCDITLEICGHIYYAHRNVLASRSPYFQDRLKAQALGMEVLTVSCNTDVGFEDFLTYLYTGHIDLHNSNITYLFNLACYFQMKQLISHCQNFLSQYLTVRNCFKIFETAKDYLIDNVYSRCLDFIRAHKLTILAGDGLVDMSLTQLEDVFGHNLLELMESEKLELIVNWTSQNEERKFHFLQLLRNVKLSGVRSVCDIIGRVQLTDRYLFDVLSHLISQGVELGEMGRRYNDLRKVFSSDETMQNIDLLDLAISSTIQCVSGREDTDNDYSNRSVAQLHSSDLLTMQSDVNASDPSLLPSTGDGDSLVIKDKTKKSTGQPGKLPIIPKRSSRRLNKKQIQNGLFNTDNIENNQRKGDKASRKPKSDEQAEDKTKEDASGEHLHIAELDGIGAKPRKSLQTGRGTKCTECSFVTSSMVDLFEHLALVHNSTVTHSCDVCSYETGSSRSFYKHMRSHLKGPPYVCEFSSCGYTVSHLPHMLNHRMKHTGKRPYACPSCALKFKTRANLIAHLKLHSGEKPFKCITCDRCFATKNTLDQHQATHSSARPFLCDSCGFTTKYQNHFIAHKRLHTGKVFRCDYPECAYFTPKRSLLTAHMRKHTGVRSHTCATCGRGFIERSHLVRHERIHMQEKPFQCDECDYSSTRRDKLKEHKNRHHSDEPTAKRPCKQRQSRSTNEKRPLTENDLLFVSSSAIKDHQQGTGSSGLMLGKSHASNAQSILNFEETGLQEVALMAAPPPGQVLVPSRNELYQMHSVVSNADRSNLYTPTAQKVHPDNQLPTIANLTNLQPLTVQPIASSGGGMLQTHNGCMSETLVNTTQVNSVAQLYSYADYRPDMFSNLQQSYH